MIVVKCCVYCTGEHQEFRGEAKLETDTKKFCSRCGAELDVKTFEGGGDELLELLARWLSAYPSIGDLGWQTRAVLHRGGPRREPNDG
jgi:hypothetical protein